MAITLPHTLFVSPALPSSCLPFLASPQRLFDQCRFLKNNKARAVGLVFLPEMPLVVKRQILRSWRQRVAALIKGSPGRRAWHGARLLQTHGFLVPQPLAVVEERTGRWIVASYYLSEGLVSQVPLGTYWEERKRGWPLARRRAFLLALVLFLRKFHQAGLYSGDMKDENILVEEGRQGAGPEPFDSSTQLRTGSAQDRPAEGWSFYLVDLERVEGYRKLSWRRRMKNLVQLDRTLGRKASRSERLLFLHSYMEKPSLDRAQWHTFITRILRFEAKKDREYESRGLKQREKMPLLAAKYEQSKRVQVSCCIISFDEEKNIRRCLESVKWCDEIVIIDSFSTDRTVAICREYTDWVWQRQWPGYVEQKRFVLSQATHEWVLNVDADEEVSPELQEEICAALAQDRGEIDGFYIPRLVYYLGRWWWRGWYPGYRLRLFRKSKVRWGGVNPHEKAILQGRTGRFRSHLYHYTYEDIGDHLRALNSLTEIAARELYVRGKQVSFFNLCLRMLWRFIRVYFLRGCFLEGVPGFFVAVTSTFYVFLKYAKLWERSVGNERSAFSYAVAASDQPEHVRLNDSANMGDKSSVDSNALPGQPTVYPEAES